MERKHNHTRQDAGRDEGRVTPERYTLPLRKGGEADVRSALAFLDHAGAVLRDHPRHFKSLLAIAEGRNEDADHASVVYLKRFGILDHNGALRPEWGEVLRSAYEVVGDGSHLSMPFDLKAEGVAEIIERVQREMDANLQDFLGSDPDPGRPGRR